MVVEECGCKIIFAGKEKNSCDGIGDLKFIFYMITWLCPGISPYQI
jgi:hypothetical protein